ncbi:unnamed protein product [Lactuca saligna]|uniref:Uncharacterized protein n=1 Tax=Lactuca saligna TaxID=75948 RepID=A0AA35VBL0_LACSI|nr:unnamed protein product [Lactuca saligna]
MLLSWRCPIKWGTRRPYQLSQNSRNQIYLHKGTLSLTFGSKGSQKDNRVIHITHSTTRHNEILCAQFWSLILRKAILKHNILVMQDPLAFSVSTSHTTGIIMGDNSKFLFTGSMLDVRFPDVPASRKIPEGFRKLNASGPLYTAKPSPKTRKAPAVSSTAAPKRRKWPARKKNFPTPSESAGSKYETELDIQIEEDQPVRHVEEENVRIEEPPICNEGENTNTELTQTLNDYVPSPPPLRKTTSIPITIALFPPPISSSQQTSVPLSTPIFTDSTILPTTLATLTVSFNVSATGAKTLGFSTHVSPATYPIRIDDPDMIFGDDNDDDLGGFTYSAFQIRTAREDEATVIQGLLMSLHEKLDNLFLASKDSFSEAYSKAVVENMFERITKDHTDNVEKMNKAVTASAIVCKTAAEKVDKLIFDTTVFNEAYQTTYNNNTIFVNASLQNLGTIFKAEKDNWQNLYTGLQNEHELFQTSITLQITKHQSDLAMESKVMDALTRKTEMVKVMDLKLENAKKKVKDLLSEKVIMKSCISNVAGLLSDIIETRDPRISITFRKHLAEKLDLVFVMLHRLEGVSP